MNKSNIFIKKENITLTSTNHSHLVLSNQTLNESKDHSFHAHSQIKVTPSILMALCCIAVLENIFVCFIIISNRRLRKATNIFIVGLCLTNVLCAGVLLPTHCYDPDGPQTGFLVIIVILIYICNLTAVTFERFVAVTWPLRYHTIITKKLALRVSILCYIAPVVYGILPLAWKADPFTVAHKVYLSATLIVFLVLPLLFILFVYAKVYLTIHKFFKRHSKHIVAHSDTSSVSSRGSQIWAEAKFMCCLHKSHLGDNCDNEETECEDLSPDLHVGNTLIRANSKRGSQRNRGSQRKKHNEQEEFMLYEVIHEECNGHANMNGAECFDFPLQPYDSILSLDDTQTELITRNTNGGSEIHKQNENNHRNINGYKRSKTINTFLPPKSDTVKQPLSKQKRLQSRHTDLSMVAPKKQEKVLRNTMSAHQLLQHPNLNNNLPNTKPKHSIQRKRKRSDSSLCEQPVRRKSSSLRSSTRSWLKFNARAKQTLSELKASLAFAMVAMTYMFTWLPVAYMSFLEVINKPEHVPPLLRAVSTYTIGLNSMIDPLLYAFLLKEFRITIGRVVRNRRSMRMR